LNADLMLTTTTADAAYKPEPHTSLTITFNYLHPYLFSVNA